MTKTSRVKEVQSNGTYDSKHGLLYKYEYTFEDGTVLNANHKSQKPFEKSTLLEYEVKGSNDFVSWGSVKKPQDNQSYGKSDNVQLYIIRQSSLTRAIEHLSHKDHDKLTKENVTALAEYYSNYVLKGI